MTDHTNIATDPDVDLEPESMADASTESGQAAHHAGDGPGVECEVELVMVDPAVLVVDRNVRADTALDRGFVASIRDHGVRQAILARRREDGALVVRHGHRRALAAVQVGLATVRVIVEPGTPGTDERDDAGAEVERIVDQLGENTHRSGLTDADEVTAHQQLLDLGLTAGQIARRTHTPRKRAAATTTVAASKLAVAAMSRYELTLDQAVVLAEFDDDTDAVTHLLATIKTQPDQFAHVTQRLRDDRTDTALVAQKQAELTDAGVRVLTEVSTDPGAGQEATSMRLTALRPTAESPSGTALPAEDHAGCPGHAATVRVRRFYNQEPQAEVEYWCTDPTTHHAARWDTITGPARGSGAAIETGDEQSQQAAAEAARVQRRRVIANNKAWDSATVVRREWLQTLLRRRTAPKDALRYVVTVLADAPHDLRRAMEAGHPTACELLGMAPLGSVYRGRTNPIAAAAQRAGVPQLTLHALAIVLGAGEDGTTRDTWRNPTAHNRAYFTTLRA